MNQIFPANQSGLPVIILADLTHSYQSFEVLIGLVGVDVVKGAAIAGVSVWCREINGDLEEETHHQTPG